MTKTLTEQWRNGKLGGRWYYIKVLGKIEIARLSKYNQFYNLPITNGYAANKDVSEVIAPVPTHDQFVELIEKVHILNEANMRLENAIDSQADYFRQQISVLESSLKEIEEALKETEGVK